MIPLLVSDIPEQTPLVGMIPELVLEIFLNTPKNSLPTKFLLRLKSKTGKLTQWPRRLELEH